MDASTQFWKLCEATLGVLPMTREEHEREVKMATYRANELARLCLMTRQDPPRDLECPSSDEEDEACDHTAIPSIQNWSDEAASLLAVVSEGKQKNKHYGAQFFRSHMKSLRLNSLKITHIGSELSKFSNLQELSLSDNALCTIEDLPTSLVSLNLSSNRLTCVPDIGHLKLRNLALAFNRIISLDGFYRPEGVPAVARAIPSAMPTAVTIPSEPGLLFPPFAWLSRLDLSFCHLCGVRASRLDALCDLPKLVHLLLIGNPLALLLSYRRIVIKVLPQLLTLDDYKVLDDDRLPPTLARTKQAQLAMEMIYQDPLPPREEPPTPEQQSAREEGEGDLSNQEGDPPPAATPSSTTTTPAVAAAAPTGAKGGKGAAQPPPPEPEPEVEEVVELPKFDCSGGVLELLFEFSELSGLTDATEDMLHILYNEMTASTASPEPMDEYFCAYQIYFTLPHHSEIKTHFVPFGTLDSFVFKEYFLLPANVATRRLFRTSGVQIFLCRRLLVKMEIPKPKKAVTQGDAIEEEEPPESARSGKGKVDPKKEKEAAAKKAKEAKAKGGAKGKAAAAEEEEDGPQFLYSYVHTTMGSFHITLGSFLENKTLFTAKPKLHAFDPLQTAYPPIFTKHRRTQKVRLPKTPININIQITLNPVDPEPEVPADAS